MLMKFVKMFLGEWNEWLRELCYSYNTNVSSNTGLFPGEPVFGLKLRIPLDVLYGYAVEDKDRLHSLTEFRRKLSTNLRYGVRKCDLEARESTMLPRQESERGGLMLEFFSALSLEC